MMHGIAHALHLIDGVGQAHQEALVQIVVYRTAQLVHPRKVPIWLDVVRQIDDLFQQGHIRLAGSVPADGLVNGVLHAEDVTGHGGAGLGVQQLQGVLLQLVQPDIVPVAQGQLLLHIQLLGAVVEEGSDVASVSSAP